MVSFNKFIGLLISLLGFLTAWRLHYTDNYDIYTIIKAYLVIFLALLIFLSITNYIPKYIFNSTATLLLFINIFVLIFSFDVISIKEICIIIAILFVIITIPSFIIKNNKIFMKSNLIDKNVWVILQTLILGIFYISNEHFYTDNCIYLIMFSLILPMIIHFTNNKWLESRLLFLTIVILLDQYY
tara:strand:+ start:4631 stop:5185 length:555 start_codon:yes stop_codon:yes gene_type:complete